MSRIIISGNCENISYYEFSNIVDDILGERPASFEEYIYPTQCIFKDYIKRYANYYKARTREFGEDLIQNRLMYNYANESPDRIMPVHICILSVGGGDKNTNYLISLATTLSFSEVEFHLFWR